MPPEHFTKIMIVDDDQDVRRLLETVLRRDYSLEEAASGEEALAKLGEFAPHSVLLDVMMPGIDGYDTCRRIKVHPGRERPQVIMVSAKSSRQEQLRGYEAGADDYVVKPIDPTELLSRVRLHCRLREATAEMASIRKEARSWIEGNILDILVTDLEMPGVNGLELLRCAKRRNVCAQVLFVTGHSTLDALTDALELGATDYLLKPLDQAELVELIGDAERRVRRWREALAGTLVASRERQTAAAEVSAS